VTEQTEMVGLGGGCHWCTEAVFQALHGVIDVEQGFMRSDPPHEDWSEAILATFRPSRIDLAVLIEIHLRTHARMSDHKLRGKYRSAIYTFDDRQKVSAENALKTLQGGFEKPLVTRVLPQREFRQSEERFQNYYFSNPDRPFCRTYIDPKLRVLREQFFEQMEP